MQKIRPKRRTPDSRKCSNPNAERQTPEMQAPKTRSNPNARLQTPENAATQTPNARLLKCKNPKSNPNARLRTPNSKAMQRKDEMQGKDKEKLGTLTTKW